MSDIFNTMTIGADPELFVYHTKRKEYVFPDFVPGNKKIKYSLGDGIEVHRDGFALEFNVPPSPLNNLKTFFTNIMNAMRECDKLIKSVDPDLELHAQPTAYFSDDIIMGLPKEELRVGCSPDLDAYRLQPIDRSGYLNDEGIPYEPNDRYAGCHLHFGWTTDADVTDMNHLETCQTLINNLVNWMSRETLYQITFDEDKLRNRGPYGHDFSFRPTPYGVEWRAPSNIILRDVDYFSQYVRSCAMCIDHLLTGGPDRVRRLSANKFGRGNYFDSKWGCVASNYNTLKFTLPEDPAIKFDTEKRNAA